MGRPGPRELGLRPAQVDRELLARELKTREYRPAAGKDGNSIRVCLLPNINKPGTIYPPAPSASIWKRTPRELAPVYMHQTQSQACTVEMTSTTKQGLILEIIRKILDFILSLPTFVERIPLTCQVEER